MIKKINTERGEARLTLGGREFRLVPNFANLAAFEDVSGISLIDLATRLHQRTIKLSEIAILISTVAEPTLSKDEAGQALVNEGLTKVINPLATFLTQSLLGGQEGNGPPAEENQKPIPSVGI